MEIGIIDSLIRIFASRDFAMISNSYTLAFFKYTDSCNFELLQQLFNRNPYPALIRLLNHQKEDIVRDSINSISNILESGFQLSDDSELHPHFQQMIECNGIQIIFNLFRSSNDQWTKNKASICIGFLFVSREINNASIRQQIIANLIGQVNGLDIGTNMDAANALKGLSRNPELLLDSDDWKRIKSKERLFFLAQNTTNRTEIEKDGFAISRLYDN
ncbi:MAG: hypothetical protein EZS28_001786 [Streblomastix strix]|uniref:Uncharacterized protein n=1 Tax=Streblomastix strix TaxID=222440 RepID=A0A5J4X7U1_9EUKA|nr:MAG: hypothetical protein EZS28_001786 [Streblomastix strix]